jgi:hypothetical protein
MRPAGCHFCIAAWHKHIKQSKLISLQNPKINNKKVASGLLPQSTTWKFKVNGKASFYNHNFPFGKKKEDPPSG